MAERINISTYSPSEIRVGYSRMVVVGNRAYISGITSVNEKGSIIGETVEEQAEYAFYKLGVLLTENDFSLNDVVRVRAFLTDMDQLSGFDRAFKRNFGQMKPACTLVGTSRLVEPNLLVEVEFDIDRSF